MHDSHSHLALLRQRTRLSRSHFSKLRQRLQSWVISYRGQGATHDEQYNVFILLSDSY